MGVTFDQHHIGLLTDLYGAYLVQNARRSAASGSRPPARHAGSYRIDHQLNLPGDEPVPGWGTARTGSGGDPYSCIQSPFEGGDGVFLPVVDVGHLLQGPETTQQSALSGGG